MPKSARKKRLAVGSVVLSNDLKAATTSGRLSGGLPRPQKRAKGPGRDVAKPSAPPLRMFLIPCSCGATFAVSEQYDRCGMHLRSFIPCPRCDKRHDPRNRLLSLGYHDEHFWKVDGC